MQNQGESEFARTSVLENCAFFTCVQCGYCGYLILGGSAKELRDEEERHAIECKATHGLIGAGSRRAYVQKRRVLRNTGGLRSTAGSRPFRPWAPDPRCRELRPVLFYLEGLDQSLSGIKNWRARSRRRRCSVLFQCTRNLDTTNRVLRLAGPRCPHPLLVAMVKDFGPEAQAVTATTQAAF